MEKEKLGRDRSSIVYEWSCHESFFHGLFQCKPSLEIDMLTRQEFNGRMRYLTIRETPVPEESEELEEQGYTIVRKAFNAKELKALRKEINQVYDERQR